MATDAIKSKSFAFALRIVKLYQFLCEQKKEYVISKQLLRSGTAVGALVREAEQAEISFTKWLLLLKRQTRASIG